MADNKMIVKSRNIEFEIDETDVFMDNGSCIQLITRKKDVYDNSIPIIAKSRWKEYKKSMELMNSKPGGPGWTIDYYRLKLSK